MRNEPRSYNRLAAIVAGGLALFQLVRLLMAGGVTQGHSKLSTLVGGLLVALLLGVAAVGLALHRRFGWLFGVVGMVVAAAHGIVIRVGGSAVGIAFLIGAAVLFPLIVKSLRFYRTEPATAR